MMGKLNLTLSEFMDAKKGGSGDDDVDAEEVVDNIKNKLDALARG